MPKRKQVSSTPTKRKRPAALSPEAREKQLISLAYDLVEERLLDGTATSQETTSLIRLGSERARLEAEKLKKENLLLVAKANQIESEKKTEELYANAIAAMREYSGQGTRVEQEE